MFLSFTLTSFFSLLTSPSHTVLPYLLCKCGLFLSISSPLIFFRIVNNHTFSLPSLGTMFCTDSRDLLKHPAGVLSGLLDESWLSCHPSPTSYRLSCSCPLPNFPLFPFSPLPYILFCLIFYVNVAFSLAFPLLSSSFCIVDNHIPFSSPLGNAWWCTDGLMFNSLQPVNHVLHLPPLLETNICTVFSFLFCVNKHYKKSSCSHAQL
jgi:hypothetical protein